MMMGNDCESGRRQDVLVQSHSKGSKAGREGGEAARLADRQRRRGLSNPQVGSLSGALHNAGNGQTCCSPDLREDQWLSQRPPSTAILARAATCMMLESTFD